jgi:hypothetical protein
VHDPLRSAYQEWLAATSTTSPNRREQYRAITRLRLQARQQLQAQSAFATQHRQQAEEEARANSVLMRRDYSWLLYPEAKLRGLMHAARVGHAIPIASPTIPRLNSGHGCTVDAATGLCCLPSG